MRRSGSKGRGGGDEQAGKAAVAVDGDKSSQHALKWAADHVLSRAQSFYLVHVRRKNTSLNPACGKQFSTSHVQEDVAASFLAQLDLQTKELMLPFQCFCSRRGLQCRDVILDGTDVSKAIVDFVVQYNVDKIVLGASSRSAFTRTIWKMDVATSVTKHAPNFCSVYVIAKGKLSTFRPATQANENDTSKEDMKSDAPGNGLLAVQSEPTSKFPGEEPSYRLMSTHAAMHIGTHFDETAQHGNLKAPVRQRSADSHLSKTSSCPSEFIRIMNKQGNHLSPEYPENHRETLFLLNKDNEHPFQAPHEEYLGIDDNALSLEYNAYGPLTPTGECASSASNCQAEDMKADLRQFQKRNGNMLWNNKELPLGTEDGTENLHAVDGRKDGPLLGRQGAKPSSGVRDAKQKLLTLETSSSDPQHRERITEEFMDHSAQKQFNPMLRRLPPKFYSPRNDRYGSAPEEKHILEPNSKPLPRPIETKRILECLPTRLECTSYNPKEIAKATNNFSDDLKVGEGGYGPVYKATLNNTPVAVKILHSNVTQGLKQFQQEIDLLNNLRHPNMVQLVGACPEYGCLIYEYMPNGSLEDRLYCRSNTPPLPWQLRFKIAVELATGLLYLHKMKPEAFVHRDLKPGNILLGEDFVCKIADVGLARIIPRSMDDTKTQYRMTDAAGTFCYIDPEYQKTGLVSTKSDVYALGIIYLQMITAKDAMGLAYAVSDALEEGTFEELLDHRVTGWPVEETKRFADLALKCCELRRRDRPDLESAVLPELVRLYALSVPSEDPSMDQSHRRSASDKDLILGDGLPEILIEGSAKGASFSA
ncbi:U-box domain-containing protein 35-like [Hordeum vulgare]|nr:U-box domain-containing protein 35-like [Hordeum vulgare]